MVLVLGLSIFFIILIIAIKLYKAKVDAEPEDCQKLSSLHSSFNCLSVSSSGNLLAKWDP